MGCANSKQAQTESRPARTNDTSGHVDNRPHAQHPAHANNQGSSIAMQDRSNAPSKSKFGPPPDIPVDMDNATRTEFLRAIHKGLKGSTYVVIGGSALQLHGSHRPTPDVDVLVASGEDSELQNRLVNQSGSRFYRAGPQNKQIWYQAKNRQSYQLDMSDESRENTHFNPALDITTIDEIKVATVPFLLDTKAKAWYGRIKSKPEYKLKHKNDVNDIKFCVQYLKRHRHEPLVRKQLRHVHNPEFWNKFFIENPEMREQFKAARVLGPGLAPGSDIQSSSGGDRASMGNVTDESDARYSDLMEDQVPVPNWDAQHSSHHGHAGSGGSRSQHGMSSTGSHGSSNRHHPHGSGGSRSHQSGSSSGLHGSSNGRRH